MRATIGKWLATAACLAMGTTAAAQTVTPKRIVAFGDSFADDDNLFRILGVPNPPVYPTGRFSGGTNFVDTLSQSFGAEQVNFAIGGAFTGRGNSGFDNINGPGIPGFPFEVDRFLAGGGAPFPTTTPRFAPDDLLAISIGGNDARFYQFNGGTVAGAAARAAISVNEAKSGLDRLVAAGARNIAFLAGNVGELPEVRGTPIAAVGSAFSTAFNAGMQAPLAGYAANGALVHYLDLTIVGNTIRANPAAFGLATADACTAACVQNPAVASQFLFYVDRVHLTSAGFAIVAEYFQRQIEAPGFLEAGTDIGLSGASQFARTMEGRNELTGAGDPERPFGVYLLAVTDRHDGRPGATSFGYDYDSTGVAGGVEYNAGGGLAGVAVSYTRPRASFDRHDARSKADAFHVGVYGAYEAGGASLSGTLGYGRYDYSFRREAVIDQLRSSTDGTSLSASAEASYGFPLGGTIKAGPLVTLAYTRARLDGFTEEGDPALTLNVQRQKRSSLVGAVGIEVKADLAAGGSAITPYLNATLAKQFEGDGRLTRFAGTFAPTIVNQVRVGERSEDVYGQIEAGASFDLGARVALQLQGAATIEQPGGDVYGGFAGVKVKF
jgi:uncharacterized protein YhjY with autotransporter beta-barrel domain